MAPPGRTMGSMDPIAFLIAQDITRRVTDGAATHGPAPRRRLAGAAAAAPRPRRGLTRPAQDVGPACSSRTSCSSRADVTCSNGKPTRWRPRSSISST